ncbi:MAG: glutamate 5-kinase [Vampirovibrionales bacterium]|nr:glutamate 5-kinase [Vampirovibrionales bacterium]
MRMLNRKQRIIVKLGTQLLIAPNGRFEAERLSALVSELATALTAKSKPKHNAAEPLSEQNMSLVIVTSGAVGLGRLALDLTPPLLLPQKQACAAVGQGQLMQTYRELWARHGKTTAQVLLTNDDFQDRKRSLALRDTLETLLAMGVIPVINENDAVSTQELAETHTGQSFGDNDRLSALLAAELNADWLILLTSVDGIYTANPASDASATKLGGVQSLSALKQISAQGGTAYGRGGMAAKLEAIELAVKSGVRVTVCDGRVPAQLGALLSQPAAINTIGTTLQPAPNAQRLKGRKRWIALASGYAGVLVLNTGAAEALTCKQASLLPVGVVAVLGGFEAGAVVSLQTEAGNELGRGECKYSASELRRVMGQASEQMSAILGRPIHQPECIHRDQLVLWEAATDVSETIET